jgi:phosphotransferase system HPr-like phosphotransfer protein
MIGNTIEGHTSKFQFNKNESVNRKNIMNLYKLNISNCPFE